MQEQTHTHFQGYVEPIGFNSFAILRVQTSSKIDLQCRTRRWGSGICHFPLAHWMFHGVAESNESFDMIDFRQPPGDDDLEEFFPN